MEEAETVGKGKEQIGNSRIGKEAARDGDWGRNANTCMMVEEEMGEDEIDTGGSGRDCGGKGRP